MGAYVVVVNAEKVTVSGNKFNDKMYRRHTGRPGSLKEETFKKLQAVRPCFTITLLLRSDAPMENVPGQASIHPISPACQWGIRYLVVPQTGMRTQSHGCLRCSRKHAVQACELPLFRCTLKLTARSTEKHKPLRWQFTPEQSPGAVLGIIMVMKFCGGLWQACYLCLRSASRSA